MIKCSAALFLCILSHQVNRKAMQMVLCCCRYGNINCSLSLHVLDSETVYFAMKTQDIFIAAYLRTL